jgi:hypothetical protein
VVPSADKGVPCGYQGKIVVKLAEVLGGMMGVECESESDRVGDRGDAGDGAVCDVGSDGGDDHGEHKVWKGVDNCLLARWMVYEVVVLVEASGPEGVFREDEIDAVDKVSHWGVKNHASYLDWVRLSVQGSTNHTNWQSVVEDAETAEYHRNSSDGVFVPV